MFRLHRTYVAFALAALCASQALAKQGVELRPKMDTSSSKESSGSLRLQGSAEVQQVINPQLAAWQGAQFYRQGGMAMQYADYANAAQCFHLSGDMFQQSYGEGRLVAESRFAEAQALRLMGQNAKAAKLFRIAADIFQKYDPYNPYLKAAMDLSGASLTASATKSKPLTGKVEKKEEPQMPKLVALPAMADSVSREVTLKGNATQLEGGVNVNDLKDEQVFRLGKALPDAIPAEVSDQCVKNTVYKAFLKMTCLESAALGGNYYTAPEMYHSFKAKGKTVVIGASDEFWSPVLRVKLGGKDYGICMDLPGIKSGSKVVLPVTDGEHVLAIDPRTNDVWKLMATPGKKTPDFNWWKLTHTKKGVVAKK